MPTLEDTKRQNFGLNAHFYHKKYGFSKFCINFAV
jgi:hypothetical protein